MNNLSNFIHLQISDFFSKVITSILTSTMDSFKKNTHRYAFELVKAAREMAVDIAEKLPHLREIRSNYQAEALKIRINKKIN